MAESCSKTLDGSQQQILPKMSILTVQSQICGKFIKTTIANLNFFYQEKKIKL